MRWQNPSNAGALKGKKVPKGAGQP
jgi:hypothetical protein